jgi:hypothetical protein
MKTKVYVILFLFLSSCDILGGKRSLDGVYRINDWALILNKDNTLILDKKLFYIACDFFIPRKFEPELHSNIQRWDTLKGTYSIKDNRFIFEKVYKVTITLVHDYDHDTLYMRAYRDSLQNYTLKKEEQDNRTKKVIEKNRRMNRKKTINKDKTITVSYPWSQAASPIFFHYPKPTPGFLSYKQDTTYYENIKMVIDYLQNEYAIDSLEKTKIKYISRSYLDPGFIRPQNLNKYFYINSLNKKIPTSDNCKSKLSYCYYINTSGKIDSLSVYSDNRNCPYDLTKVSKEILGKIEAWPQGTFLGKPMGYYESDSYYIER